jgi:SAM-dependent methyltransferase
LILAFAFLNIESNLTRMLPWFLKIPAKMLLSRLPVSLRTWQKLNLFRAGSMDDEAYARGVFDKHLAAAGLADLAGRTVLELGPGNGLLTGKFAHDLGAAKTWLIDSSPIAEPAAFPNTTYMSGGLASLKTIPSASVDFLFSHAVLEHVRLREFGELIAESRRVLKKDGVASHQIDFRDHLGGALNNLRFSEERWESEFMAFSGFYTNRIPWMRMKEIFEQTGFSVAVIKRNCWPELPTDQARMAPPYSSMKADDLRTWDCHVVLRPTADRAGD